MKLMPLEKRGISNSRVVFGCMGLGGGWNHNALTKEDYIQAEKAIDASLSIGITMFDHADIYTFGKAEAVFGQILKNKPELRQKMILQSKCGVRLEGDGLPKRFDFSKEHILNAIDVSLQRLGTDYLDTYLLHRPDPLMEPEEIAEAFHAIKAAVKSVISVFPI